MEILFLLLRRAENLQAVLDLMGEYGKVTDSSLYMLPMLEGEEFVEAFFAALTIEFNVGKAEKAGKEKQLTVLAKWIYFMDKRSFQVYDAFREAGVSIEDYKLWVKEHEPEDSLIHFYEKDLNKKHLLRKWAKVLYFLIKTSFPDEYTQRLVKYWIEISHEGDELTEPLIKDFETFEDEEIGLESSLFLIKQKLIYWLLSKQPSEFVLFELLASQYSLLDFKFSFIGDDVDKLLQFIKFVFVRFVASKFINSFAIQNWMVREKIRCLELGLGSSIWIGHELSPTLFDSQIPKRPLDREKWDSYFQKIFKESLDSFISKTEENMEYVIAEHAKGNRRRSEAYCRMQYISFLLAFNANTKYQSKININLKALKSMPISLKAIKKNIFALELEHLAQLKNYKSSAILLTKLHAFERIDTIPMISTLLQRIPDKNLTINEIDRLIFTVTDFSWKRYEYTSKGLELFLSLEYFSDIDGIDLHDIKLVVSTGSLDSPTIESIVIPTLTIKSSESTIELTVIYRSNFRGTMSFLTIQALKFHLLGIEYCIEEFPDIKNRNIDLNAIQCLCINSSGFINRLTPDLIFFEENGPNFFFIEFSVFDNRSDKIQNLIIDLLKSSKYLIINPKIKLISDTESKDLKMEFERLSFPEIASGRYVMILTLYLLHSKMKNYKLKLNSQGRGKPFFNVINLKTKTESFYYLENQLQYINESYSQLKVSNSNEVSINLHQINDKVFSPVRVLGSQEELSLIVSNRAKETNLVYELNGYIFESQPIHSTIQRHCPDLIKSGSLIKGKVLRIEQFILNKDLNIKSLEIKNKKDVKIFEQNHFVLHYQFNGSKLSESEASDSTQIKRIYLELKWNREKYCIIGKHRFLLKYDCQEKHKEIAFIPFESGFLSYPQILLVETKADGSEIQHLLNEQKHLKIFFVHENVMKAAQYAGKNPRIG